MPPFPWLLVAFLLGVWQCLEPGFMAAIATLAAEGGRFPSRSAGAWALGAIPLTAAMTLIRALLVSPYTPRTLDSVSNLGTSIFAGLALVGLGTLKLLAVARTTGETPTKVRSTKPPRRAGATPARQSVWRRPLPSIGSWIPLPVSNSIWLHPGSREIVILRGLAGSVGALSVTFFITDESLVGALYLVLFTLGSGVAALLATFAPARPALSQISRVLYCLPMRLAVALLGLSLGYLLLNQNVLRRDLFRG